MRSMGQFGKQAQQFSAAHRQRHQVRRQNADTAQLVQVQRSQAHDLFSAPSDSVGITAVTPNPSAQPETSISPYASVAVPELPEVLPILDQSDQDDVDSRFDTNDIAERVYQIMMRDIRERQYRNGKRFRF